MDDFVLEELRQENDAAYSALRAANGDQPVPFAWNDEVLSPQQRDEMQAREIMKKVLTYTASKEDAYLNLRERIQTRSDRMMDISDGVASWLEAYADTYFAEEKAKNMENSETRSILPEGWKWHHYEDGSGALYAPDGNSYFEYDLYTREFKLDMKKKSGWSYRDNLSLREFVLYAEDEVMKKITSKELEMSEQTVKKFHLLNKSFMDKVLDGQATLDEIDDYVDYWHNMGEQTEEVSMTLREYLGLTAAEYERWGKNGDEVLQDVLNSRKKDMKSQESHTSLDEDGDTEHSTVRRPHRSR